MLSTKPYLTFSKRLCVIKNRFNEIVMNANSRRRFGWPSLNELICNWKSDNQIVNMLVAEEMQVIN